MLQLSETSVRCQSHERLDILTWKLLREVSIVIQAQNESADHLSASLLVYPHLTCNLLLLRILKNAVES